MIDILAAERLHGDDTIVPILAKGKTDTGRISTYAGMTGRLAGYHRLRHCSTHRETGDRSIPCAT